MQRHKAWLCTNDYRHAILAHMAKANGYSPTLDRTEADDILYGSLRAVYHYERELIRRFGLGFQEVYMLQLLRRRESACVGEIAKALDIAIFSTTRLTQRLQTAGLVSKRRCDNDRRSVSVRLEPQGETLVSQIEAYNFTNIVEKTIDAYGDDAKHFVLVAKSLGKILSVEPSEH